MQDDERFGRAGRAMRPWIVLAWSLVAGLAVVQLMGCGGAADSDADASAEKAAADAEYADAMATEHAGETPTASGAADAAAAGGESSVMAEDVVYGSVGERELTGYLARPESAEVGGPAVIVIQEWWGLNDNIRDMARALAGHGYTALAVDLYDDQVATTRDEARALVQAAMERESELEENLREAYRYLTEEGQATAVGSIGWCFGGGWSLRTALLFPTELDAAVIYYGRVLDDRETLAPLEVPVLGLFGADDEGIPVESVRAFETAMQELGKSAEIHVYEGADHAFANPSGQRYDAEVAERAWAETLAFFGEHLHADGGGA
ncbi:MAG: dienelactone hydrolase family protein [Acidobacteriota bacterium]